MLLLMILMQFFASLAWSIDSQYFFHFEFALKKKKDDATTRNHG